MGEAQDAEDRRSCPTIDHKFPTQVVLGKMVTRHRVRDNSTLNIASSSYSFKPFIPMKMEGDKADVIKTDFQKIDNGIYKNGGS